MRSTVTQRVLATEAILGDRVRNPLGEDLGEIKDLMIDVESGRIVYAVLSFGGFLGLGDKLFAIPWAALELRPEEHQFVLDVDKERLAQAPGFDKQNWPDMADRRWQTDVHAHYRVEPYWEELSTEHPR